MSTRKKHAIASSTCIRRIERLRMPFFSCSHAQPRSAPLSLVSSFGIWLAGSSAALQLCSSPLFILKGVGLRLEPGVMPHGQQG